MMVQGTLKGMNKQAEQVLKDEIYVFEKGLLREALSQ